MKLNLSLPAIKTQQDYYYTPGGQTITVVLGFIGTGSNVVETYYTVNVYLKDTLIDEIVYSDQVQIELNSFNVEYTFDTLDPERIYLLTVQSLHYQTTTTVINTMSDMSSIQIIDREHVFSDNFRIYGNMLEPLDDNTVDYKKGVDPRTRSTGTSIIIDNDQYYAFCPTHILTTIIDYPAVLSFIPFVGLPAREIKVHIVPRIEFKHNQIFTVTPPTKLRIVNLSANLNYTTPIAVSQYNLADYGVTQNGTYVRPVFT